ncbi:MAG: class I SAM-dependent methyltransferase, partial [Candidatus Methylomirabilis sp.]|nr:class I SAM-dependent methyltransferase [Deltaproteobacteria bacterium]
CTLLQMRAMPSESELYDFYQAYDVVGERDPYFRALWGPDALETGEGRQIRARAQRLLALRPRPRRVLEVGSGHGLFLGLLTAAGVHAEGVELSARAAEKSRRLHGVEVHTGTLDSLPAATFDAIAMWDLLEHVPDPGRLLEQVAARLEPGGVLIIETPDEAALLDRVIITLGRLGITWPADHFYGLHHLVLFRRATLRRLLEARGLRVVGMEGASTCPARIFGGRSLRDRAARLFLGGLTALARCVDRQNKMIVTARRG